MYVYVVANRPTNWYIGVKHINCRPYEAYEKGCHKFLFVGTLFVFYYCILFVS